MKYVIELTRVDIDGMDAYDETRYPHNGFYLNNDALLLKADGIVKCICSFDYLKKIGAIKDESDAQLTQPIRTVSEDFALKLLAAQAKALSDRYK